jgi:hypothetical protein
LRSGEQRLAEIPAAEMRDDETCPRVPFRCGGNRERRRGTQVVLGPDAEEVAEADLEQPAVNDDRSASRAGVFVKRIELRARRIEAVERGK